MRVLRVATIASVLFTAFAAQAMPNFARREGFDCSTCHNTIPRLNKFGYQFRNAGFRVPSTIGTKQKDMPEFGTMNAARLQSDAEWHHERARSLTVNQGQLNFFEATLYPLTGSFGRWWSSEGELSVASEDFFEVENAYLRGTFGTEQMHFNARVGVFHPWEGYGASDRPVTIARPTFQRNAARWRTGDGGTSYFTPWGFDEVGLEGGFTFGDFNVAATVFNGLTVTGSAFTGDDAFKGQPFQGGDLVRSTNDPAYNSKDFQVFANEFIGDAAVSAHWYHGRLSIPTNEEAIGSAGSTTFTDHFDRLTLYGTLPVPLQKLMGGKKRAHIPEIWVLGGFERGWDRNVPTDRFTSQGWFGEVYSPVTPKVGASVRYDWWDSSRNIADNTQQVLTAALNVAALNGAQGILEYRHVSTELNSFQNRNRDQLELRVLYIF